MTKAATMSMRQFRRLLASYGAEPHRWPVGQRAEARALLAVSAEARRLADAERGIDLAFETTSRRATEWPRGDGEEAALVRLRSGVAARIASPPAARLRASGAAASWLRGLGSGAVGGPRLASGVLACLSVLAGLLLGVSHPAPQGGGGAGIVLLLQASPIAGLP